MKTLAVDFLLKETPIAIAIIDTKLNFINYSNQWQSDFTLDKTDLRGKFIFDVVIDTPILFKNTIKSCLANKKEYINSGQKFTLLDGKVKWLKWKISPWKNDNNILSGIMIFLEDITRDQKELELLHKAEEVARIGCWELDLQTNSVNWTKTTKDIHEVNEDYIINLEKGINFYKEGVHRHNISKLVNDAITKGTPFDTELIIVTAKGNEVWVRAKGEVESVNKIPVRLVGTFQDIDQRKKLELAHVDLLERLKITTQTTKIGIWEYNLITNELVWDNEMYNIFGISKKEFTGVFEAWSSTIHPADREKTLQATEDAINGKKDFDEEFRIKLQDGSIRYIKGLSKTIIDLNGKAVKMTGVNWDITELRSTELKLESSAKSFTKTFDNAAIGMALVSPELKWLKVNKSLTKSLGYTEKELLKMKTTDITYPEDLENSSSFKSKVFNGKKNNYQLQKRYFHKNGDIVHAVIGVTPVKDLDGKTTHAITQFLDITDRIRSEKKLKDLLKVTKSQNESLMNFAHIVSHNLRSHSTNLTMLTTFLTKEKKEEERLNIIRMIMNAAESLSETISHLNDVVQVKTTPLKNLQRINILKTIHGIEKSIKGLIEKEDATIKLSISSSHFASAVPAYLESIFLNILTNALKYRSKDRLPVIEVKSFLKEDNILITFSDNGQGIDLKRHGDKIFGMYKTFHEHKDAKGIGLFITKNQIESMGGSINIESVVDKGSTFFIELKQI